MKKLLSPKYCLEFCSKSKKIIGLLTFIFIAVGMLYGPINGPIDYQQLDAVKIIYVHVPAALLSLSVYTIIFFSSVIYLVWRIKIADLVAKVSAPFGATITAIALLTGAIWGKPMWGSWWVWDARLTSELILLFIYIGYIALRNGIPNRNTAAVCCSIFAIVGMIDIPIIHFSVEWWYTLHQGASISKFSRPSIDYGMLIPLIIMLIGFYLLYVFALCHKLPREILEREKYFGRV